MQKNERAIGMTKAEIAKLEKMRERYLHEKRKSDEVFNRSPWEYDELNECEKRKGDQAYGYAQGIYDFLAVLGQSDGLPPI